MSDEGEKTCPLCAEEMDLTDQQLRPCKCGYEICVWCFHHIMDMAEKDNTDGRCPACRTRYNKEKIVGTASKCERLVTGMSVEKKQKSQKGRTKTLEGKKQLGSVRVIQRNLVYIVGLPLNLADEDLLQQKEYFGQYGKVLKVSISRTATGAIQQFANSTCSVYITYSKEEEAVRSIQSAHGFVLEGRTLRACFGTTKYCHAWLRNAPCTIADCLYLHEFGPQEDSFTKDEIISAYTRNRVQQITGATNEMERRSGNILPPPADDFSINKSTSSWPKPISKITTNNPAIGIKVPLTNSSNGKSVALPAAASCGTRTSNSQLSSKEATNQQADVSTPTPSFSSTVVSPLSNGDESVKEKGSLGNPVSIKENRGGTDKNISRSSEIHHPDPVLDEAERRICPLSVDMSSNISNQKRLQACESEQFLEPLTTNETETTSKQSDLVSDLQKKVAISEAEQDDMLSFNDQRLRDAEVTQNNSTGFNRLHAHASANGGLHPPSSLHANNIPVVKGYSSDVISNSSREVSNGLTYFHGTEGRKSQKGGLDLGESSIISNILSMDFDPWDESLISPRNLAKFLGESDKQVESNIVLNLRKAQNSNQSRFSFARQDEGTDNYGDFGAEYKNFRSDFVSNNSVFVDNKLSNGNGFSSFSYGESENFATNYFSMNENEISVSRAQVSAPPGFSGPNRAPPPGFGSKERMEQTFDNLSGNHMLDACSLLGKSHQTAAPVNMGGGGGDIEFTDPAILAVGGRVNTQLNSIENDIRLQLLMQTSFSQQQIQNPRFSQLGLNYPQQTTDSYGISSRMFENNLSSHQQPISSSVSNAHWNEFQNGNDIRNQRLGFNTYYHEDAKFQMPMPMPTSGHLYNRTFGI